MISALNNYSPYLINFLLINLIQNTLFLILILLLLKIIRSAPASVKFSVGFIALIKLIIPSFLPFRFFPNQLAVIQNTVYKLSPIIVESNSSSEQSVNVFSIVLISWTLISAALIIYYIFSHALFVKKIDKNKTREIDNLNLPVLCKCKVFTSPVVQLPVTTGFFRKKIFMPESWHNWDQDKKDYVLGHEIAHINRNDSWLSLFQLLVKSIYFFHPLVWILNRQISSYAEMACDDLATGSHIDKRMEYSKILFNFVETMVPSHKAVLSTSALIRQKEELLQRVIYLIKEEQMTKFSKKHKQLLYVALGLLIIIFSWQCTKTSNTADSSKITVVETQVNNNEPPPPEPPSEESEVPIFVPYDEPPQPVGGYKEIQKNLKYPEIAKKAGIEGRVVVNALIDQDGNIVETKVASSLGDKNGCDEAAVNAVKAVKWKPAIARNKPVKVWVAIPIQFTLR